MSVQVNTPERYWLRTRAINAVYQAKQAGLIPWLDGSIACVDCGQPASVYDHRDYYKPLEVSAVCQRCNLKRGHAHPLPAEL